nr:MAG: hypothetical protein DIU56_11350 [Pseudomonadota bacterium]
MASWVMSTVFSAGYLGIVFLMFLENVFPPIPSELIMPLAGYMAGSGKLALLGVILAGTAGSVLGAVPLYWAGRRIGEKRLRRFADRHGRWLTVSCRDIDRAKRWFDRYGWVTVLFCRLVPGVRSLISIPAGLNHMNPATFLVLTAIGSAAWTALLAWLGYVLGRNFGAVQRYLDPVSWVVLGSIAVYYVYRVVTHRPESSPAR